MDDTQSTVGPVLVYDLLLYSMLWYGQRLALTLLWQTTLLKIETLTPGRADRHDFRFVTQYWLLAFALTLTMSNVLKFEESAVRINDLINVSN